MKVFSKRIFSTLLSVTLLVSACVVNYSVNGLADKNNTSNVDSAISKGEEFVITGNSAEIAQNDAYSLVYYKDPVSFAIVNRTSGEAVFNTSVANEKYDIENSSATWKNYMQAIAAIKYAGKDEYKGNTMQDFSSASTTDISIYRTENGIWVDMYFSKSKIGFAFIVQLSGNAIDVTIPETSIIEDGDYELLSIEVFPFMGASLNTDEGYIVYPDGSGALTYFDKISEKHLYTTAYSLDVYSSLTQDEIGASENSSGMLPIYGIKSGNNAFLAAITKGDSSASIKINPAVNTSAVKLNRASFELIYRNSHRFYLSNLVVDGKDVSSTIYGTEWSENIIPGDRSIRYFILEGTSADYSGMANAYRSYLIENGKLQTKASVNKYRTSVSMIMGAVEETMFATNYVTSTSFQDVTDFINLYNSSGMNNYLVTLSGWNKGGINNYKTYYKPESQLGGSKGLKTLNKLFNNIYLETDVTSNNTERNAVKNGNLIPITNYTETKFVANLESITKKFNKLQSKLKKYDSLNVAFRDLGMNIYHDSGDVITYRSDEIRLIRDILSKSEKISVQGGNLYLLDLADYLYDIPTSTSDNVIIDEEIPFYSMVVYGSIPYSGESGNNSSNHQKTKLKWLEYGCIPYFEVTKESPQVLQNTDRNYLYSSRNEYWKDNIAECNKEWNEKLNAITGAYMIKHQKLSDTLVKVSYSNGYYLIINYAGEDVEYASYNIPAESYIIDKE